MKRIVLGLTGASGSIYFLRLLESLVTFEMEIHVIASIHGAQVFQYEIGCSLEEKVKELTKIGYNVILEDNENMFSKVASGSYQCDTMVIVPCSMSTLAEIANGVTKSLLTRASDVFIKERRRLVLVPRETPFSSIHLKNMYELSNLGVTILPAMPGFYNHPESLDDIINFVVGKTLDAMKLEHNLYRRWEGNN